jgi:hypothetical protein
VNELGAKLNRFATYVLRQNAATDSLLRFNYQYPHASLCQCTRCRQAGHPRANYHNFICFTCHSRLDAQAAFRLQRDLTR